MAAKDKEEKKKPVIKVEEVKDDEVVEKEEKKENEEEETSPKKETEEEVKTKPVTPAVSSFSQLDAAPPSPSTEKGKGKDSTEKTSLLDVKLSDKDSESKKADEKVSEEESSGKEQISSDEVKEWLKDVRPDTTKESEKGRGLGGKLILLIVLALIVIGAVVGGVLYFQKGVSLPTTEPQPTEVPKETATPTPVEEEVDLTTISVNVLNGSGIAGEAGKVKDLLSSGGFSEDNIETGNAVSYDYEAVTVSKKSDTSEKVTDAIKEALSNEYEVSVSTDNLEDDSEYDILIIVGK